MIDICRNIIYIQRSQICMQRNIIYTHNAATQNISQDICLLQRHGNSLRITDIPFTLAEIQFTGTGGHHLFILLTAQKLSHFLVDRRSFTPVCKGLSFREAIVQKITEFYEIISQTGGGLSDFISLIQK